MKVPVTVFKNQIYLLFQVYFSIINLFISILSMFTMSHVAMSFYIYFVCFNSFQVHFNAFTGFYIYLFIYHYHFFFFTFFFLSGFSDTQTRVRMKSCPFILQTDDSRNNWADLAVLGRREKEIKGSLPYLIITRVRSAD